MPSVYLHHLTGKLIANSSGNTVGHTHFKGKHIRPKIAERTLVAIIELIYHHFTHIISHSGILLRLIIMPQHQSRLTGIFDTQPIKISMYKLLRWQFKRYTPVA